MREIKNRPSLLLPSQWAHCVPLHSNKMRANVDQKTGKYLTERVYTKSQMNNIVFRNMCLNVKANIPCPALTIAV